MSTAGSVVYIAYAKSETWTKPAWKLFKRGWQLIGIYYLYSIIKLFTYDFSKEPFYWQYTEHGRMTWQNILSLQVFSSPIGILLTIGALIILSPLLLLITRKLKFSNSIIFGLLVVIAVAVYGFSWSGPLSNLLFSRNLVMFPLATWSIPFLIGYLVASLGFEEKKHWWLAIFLPLTAILYYYQTKIGLPIKPSNFMYPLKPYYLSASLLLMTLLFYIFYVLEKIPNKIIKYKLSLIRFLGDFTLSVYIGHWIVIDMMLWVFYPHYKLIWLAVPIYLICFVLLKYKKFQEYVQNQI
jgi:hypothetical protein